VSFLFFFFFGRKRQSFAPLSSPSTPLPLDAVQVEDVAAAAPGDRKAVVEVVVGKERERRREEEESEFFFQPLSTLFRKK